MGRLFITWLIALCALIAPAAAQTGGDGWWNQEWPYRRAVTIDTAPTGSNLAGPIGRTVVLVRLHNGNFSFTDVHESGADLRVVDADGKTPLPFHIERFDAANGIATLWVAVPGLTGGEQRRLWLYFGNKTAPAGSDIAGTFDPETLAVFHFSEASGQAVRDHTAHSNHARNSAPEVNEGGIVGRSARFSGAGEVVVPDSPSLAMPEGAPLTVTTWVKPEQVAGEQAIFTRGSLVLGLADGLPFVLIGDQRLQASRPLTAGSWSHLAFVADGETLRLFVDGVEAAQGTGTLPALAGDITLGGAPGRPFSGELDETRLARVAAPAAMIAAQVAAEGATGTLVRVADTAERQSKGGGTFFYVLSKVEPIDAAIIALCLFILAVAVTVTVTKARYIAEANRANTVFLQRFHDMHEDLVSLDEVAEISPAERRYIERAPLFRLFETGIEERDSRRLARGARPLSGAAVEAMRSAVDAVVVKENQKLDSWMVVLTIAISGGPFIGLLGTVLGVMNTFGGVALAGDVNVNAIAPGIAAALMATIAGLACAIPSLFAYNYLNTRITALSDDMRVFVDRLITRLAEMQENLATGTTRQAAE